MACDPSQLTCNSFHHRIASPFRPLCLCPMSGERTWNMIYLISSSFQDVSRFSVHIIFQPIYTQSVCACLVLSQLSSRNGNSAVPYCAAEAEHAKPHCVHYLVFSISFAYVFAPPIIWAKSRSSCSAHRHRHTKLNHHNA